MVSEQLAESSELSLTSVLLAELECLMCGCLIEKFESGIVLEDLQNCSVSLPQEFQPWCDDRSICSVFRLFTRDRGKEDCFRGLSGFEVFDVARRGTCSAIKRRLDLFSFCLRLLNLLFGEFG